MAAPSGYFYFLRVDSNLRQRSLDLGGLAGLAFVDHAVGKRVLPAAQA
jgi:hypothetical protein